MKRKKVICIPQPRNQDCNAEPIPHAIDSEAHAVKRLIQSSIALLILVTGSIAALLLSVLPLGQGASQAIRFGTATLAGLVLLALSHAYLKLRANHRELHAALEKLKAAKETAESSERCYRKLMELSPYAVLLGRDGRFLTTNEAAVRLFRIESAQELVGRTLEDFVTPEFRTLLEQERDQELVIRFLRRNGHQVLLAGDGYGGVSSARQYVPDLILMDLGLPGLGGCEAARQIKSARETAHIPIIALTAHTISDDVRKPLKRASTPMRPNQWCTKG